jgi:protein-S-isoprenylcysteine O-methyltransferase Ste14
MFKRYADFVARLRVPCGFVLVLAFAWLSRPTFVSLAEGLPVSLAGLALRAWATGHLEKNQRLTRSGPYSFIRNPLYLGTLLVAAGFVVAGRQWILAALFAAVFLLVYLPVIELEEQHLRNLFPEFTGYAHRVPALFPSLHRERHPERFRPTLYLRNREYEALTGFMAGVAFLVGKILIGR